MSKDLDLRLRLTATDKNVAGTVRNTKKEVQGLNETLGATNSRTRGTASGLSGVTTAGQEATRMFKLQKGSLQQAGFQFQDLAVQVGSGTSAFVAIGQQGSQLLGIFGPGGAVLGAILAFGSVIGGSFYNSIMSAKEGMGALEKSTDFLDEVMERAEGGAYRLTEQIRELAAESKVAAEIEIQRGLVEATAAFNSARAGLLESAEDSLDTTILGDFDLAISQAARLARLGTDVNSAFAEFGDSRGAMFREGLSEIRSESENLASEFGITIESARSLIGAIGTLKADPTTESFRDLQQVLFDANDSADGVSAEFTRLTSELALLAQEGVDAAKKGEMLEQWSKDLASALEESNPELTRAREETQKLVEKLETQAETQGKTTLEMIRYNEAADIKTATDNEATAAQLASIRASYDQIYAYEQNSIATKEAEKAQREYERSLDSLLTKLQPVRSEFEQFRRDQELLNTALSEGDISPERFQLLTDSLVQSFADTGEEASDRFVNPFEDAAGRVSQAVQNAIASGEWDTIGEAIGNTLASSISSIIDTSITQSLAKDLTANSGVGQQLAAAFAGPLLGAVAGGVVQLAVRELDDYFSDDWDPTAARQAANGAGTVLGDINAKSESIRRAVEGSESGIGQLIGINQGMLNALQNLQSGISGASDRIARGRGGVSIGSPGVQSGRDIFDDATGGVIPLFDETLTLAFDFFDEATNILTLGLVDLGDLLGGKSRRVDEGVQIIGGYLSDLIDETIVNAYATFRVKKHAFDDYDTTERFSRIGGDVERQFAAVFGSLFDTVLEAGLAIGYDEQSVLDALNQRTIGTARISLEGLNAEQQQKELEAYFSGVFDDMAGGIFPFLEDFQEAGEGLGETLVRVAGLVQVTEEAVNRLGLQFSDLAGRDLVEASQRLIEASGGIEQFIGSMQGFIENFATEARQFELAQSDLTRSLGQAGLELPNTRQGFFDLLQAQDAATASGAENVAILLRLQEVADQYYTRLEDYQAEALQAQQDMIRTQRNLVTESLRDAEDAARSVRDALGGLTVESEAFSQARRESAIASLRQMAGAGVVRPGDALNSALSTASNVSANQFGSFEAYIREVASTGGLLSELDTIAQEQVTVEQRMLDTLDRQAELLEQGNADQLAALNALQESVNQNTAVATASPTIAGGSSQAQSSGSASVNGQSLLLEVRELKSQIKESQRSIARHTQRSARILERLEIDGIEVRE